jgi:ribosomal protein L29
MKKKDLQSLKTKSLIELKKLAEEKKIESEAVKAKVIAGQEKNLKARKNLRIEVARILTLIREKSIIESLEVKEVKEEKKK